MTRNWLPCWVCGTTHQNPRSSSTCPDCGMRIRRVREAIEKEEEEEETRVDPVTAAMNAAYGFDMEQKKSLRDMFQAFYDAL